MVMYEQKIRVSNNFIFGLALGTLIVNLGSFCVKI